MSQAEERAALDVGVTAVADPTGVKGIFYRAAGSATRVDLAIPQVGGSPVDPTRPMRGKWLNFFSSAANLQYAFSTTASAAAITYNALVTAGTGSATAGATIPTGQVISKIIPSNATFVSIIAESSAGFVELYVSEAPG